MIALINSDSRHIPLADQSVQCVITSPPYWGLRSYNTGDNKHLEIGAEQTPQEYVSHIVEVMREVWRVLRDDGTAWINLGDTYSGGGRGLSDTNIRFLGKGTAISQGSVKGGITPDGLKPKDLVGIPWRVAFALQDDGWYLRQDIIWHKPNPMPESVTDRCTKAHEYIFLFAKGQWKTRIVSLPDLGDERVHFFKNFRLESSYSGASAISIRLASSILDFAQSEHQFSLLALNSQEWINSPDNRDGVFVSGTPEIHRAAILSARFLNSDITTKDFLHELNSIFIALPDGDNFLKGRILPSVSDAPCINCDRDASVTINYSGDVCEFVFVHENIITRSHTGCKYYYDAEAIKEAASTPIDSTARQSFGGPKLDDRVKSHAANNGKAYRDERDVSRNRRSVWTVATSPYSGAHYATFPTALVEPMILAGSRKGDIVLDPFCGSGTVGQVCRESQRSFVGLDLSATYLTDNAMPRAAKTNTAQSMTTLPLFSEAHRTV